jgi:PAS domain-containing protein
LAIQKDEMTSQPWINLVAPEDRDLVRSTLGALDGSTEPARFESRMIRKDGSWRWIEWSVVWHGGLAYAIGRDITERRHEQDQLYKTRTMLEASRDGLSVLAKQQEPCAGWPQSSRTAWSRRPRSIRRSPRKWSAAWIATAPP